MTSPVDKAKQEEDMWDLVHMLLDHLPDNRKHEQDDRSWKWAWDALSNDAQDEVMRIRAFVEGSLRGVIHDQPG